VSDWRHILVWEVSTIAIPGQRLLERCESIFGDVVVTATAHKLARVIYHLLRTREPYNETVFAKEEAFALRQAEVRLRKHAAKLGFQVVPAEASNEA
jgi:hypothetical protein